MSLEVTYGEYKKPQVGVKYPVLIWEISDAAKQYMFDHLRKVVAVTCFKNTDDAKRALDVIVIDNVATGEIDGNTVLWVNCSVDGVYRRILVNTPQLKTFEPYFIDGKVTVEATALLSPSGTWGFYNLEDAHE